MSWTDAAGNVEFRLATFFLEFLALLVITVILCVFFFRHRSEPLWEGFPNQGNVMRMFLILVGIVEIIADSTRYDSALMHFFLIKKLNPYASFISIAQVFSAVMILLVFIRYMRCSVKANGWSWYHILAILVFIASLVGIGFFGEYRVQWYVPRWRCSPACMRGCSAASSTGLKVIRRIRSRSFLRASATAIIPLRIPA